MVFELICQECKGLVVASRDIQSCRCGKVQAVVDANLKRLHLRGVHDVIIREYNDETYSEAQHPGGVGEFTVLEFQHPRVTQHPVGKDLERVARDLSGRRATAGLTII